MPTLQDYRTELNYAYYSQVFSYNGKIGTYGAQLDNFFETGIGSASNKQRWKTFRESIVALVWWLIGESYQNYNRPLINWLELAESGTGGDVDMDAILTAMTTANFDQLQHFIGLVDAYRVALWNAPFNADFYAALARGFQQWP